MHSLPVFAQCFKEILFPGYFVDFTPFLVTNVLDWQQQQQQLSMSFNRWLVGPLTWWLDPIYHGLLLLLNVSLLKKMSLVSNCGKNWKKMKMIFFWNFERVVDETFLWENAPSFWP